VEERDQKKNPEDGEEGRVVRIKNPQKETKKRKKAGGRGAKGEQEGVGGGADRAERSSNATPGPGSRASERSRQVRRRGGGAGARRDGHRSAGGLASQAGLRCCSDAWADATSVTLLGRGSRTRSARSASLRGGCDRLVSGISAVADRRRGVSHRAAARRRPQAHVWPAAVLTWLFAIWVVRRAAPLMAKGPRRKGHPACFGLTCQRRRFRGARAVPQRVATCGSRRFGWLPILPL
jgi:hypothetical protein